LLGDARKPSEKRMRLARRPDCLAERGTRALREIVRNQDVFADAVL
jgi:hypothetical protein